MVLLGLLAKVTRPRVGVTLVFCCPGRQGAFNPATLAPGPYKETRLHLFKKKKKTVLQARTNLLHIPCCWEPLGAPGSLPRPRYIFPNKSGPARVLSLQLGLSLALI